jgi:hypothetical protein
VRVARSTQNSLPAHYFVVCKFHEIFGRTVALGSTQPLTEMSARNISWGVKAAGA